MGMPYMRGTSEILHRMIKQYGVNFYRKPFTNLRQQLSHTKDKTPTLQQCGMIYHVKYKDCDHDYVGEMARALGTILKEHQASSAVMNIALQQVIPSHLMT